MIRFHKLTGKSKLSPALRQLKLRKYSTQSSQYSSPQWRPREVETYDSPYTETAEYPKILDLNPKAVLLRQKEAYYEKIKNIETVEEKLYALLLPKWYGWPSYMLQEGVIPYNYLPFTQFITRTVISESSSNTLPTRINDDNLKALLPQVKSELEKVLLFENKSKRFRRNLETKFIEEEKAEYISPLEEKNLKSRHLINQMNSALIRILSPQYPHLFSAQIDYEPRIEAFWRVGGFHPSQADIKLRKEKKLAEELCEEPIDRFFQYFGSPALQVRNKLPLPPLPRLPRRSSLVTEDEMRSSDVPLVADTSSNTTDVDLNKDKQMETGTSVVSVEATEVSTMLPDHFYDLQEYRYLPDLYLGVKRERIHGAVVPGFWPNDPSRFGIVSYHTANHLHERPSYYTLQEHKEALHSQAILASFAWAYGLACYQGFTTYNDLTYPFTTQSILVDDKAFSFYQYQLNTITLHTDKTNAENPLYNECYATPPLELYSDINGDEVEGWNDDVLMNLLALYTNVPEPRDAIDLCPYLNKNVKYVSMIEDRKRRVFMHKTYRHFASHRPRHKLDPEIYDWERIFKIEHQARVTDARKRFFEKFEDPINDRRLCDVNIRLRKADKEPFRPNKIWDDKAKKMKHGRYADTYHPDAWPDYHEIV